MENQPKKIDNISIVRFNKRYTVKCKYNQELINFFKTINSRIWNAVATEWSFPNESYDEMTKFLNQNNFSFTQSDLRNYAEIHIKDDKITLFFKTFFPKLGELKEIGYNEYQKEHRLFIFDSEKLTEVETALKRNGFTYAVMVEPSIATDEIPQAMDLKTKVLSPPRNRQTKSILTKKDGNKLKMMCMF